MCFVLLMAFSFNINVFAHNGSNGKLTLYTQNISLEKRFAGANGDECNGLLGEDFTVIINNISRFIQYLGPILVAVFTTIDFLKAVLSGDPADMKKASSKFSKRLVAAILLFFAPLLCKLIFSVTGITVPDSCIGL